MDERFCDVNEVIKENGKRLRIVNLEFDPTTGEGQSAISRTKCHFPGYPIEYMWLPDDMIDTEAVALMKNKTPEQYLMNELGLRPTLDVVNELWREFIKLRIQYDFEYWAYTFIPIRAKAKPIDIPFKLNRAQRHYLSELEKLRMKGVPIRIVLLKARQWGGSTLTQIYMLWIQMVHMRNWNSCICGDVESQATTVRAMISKALKTYPSWLLDGEAVKFLPFEGSHKTKIITPVQCVVSVGSVQKPENLRSQDIAMAHLTEVGLWRKTEGKSPEDLTQSIFGSVFDAPFTVEVMESTAKGVGNFFHRYWVSAVKGSNNFTPVFIPWFLIDMYSEEVPDYAVLIETFDDYDWSLWELGATLEAIAWYKRKAADMERWRMNSEFPSTATEAFQSTGRRRFRPDDVRKMERTCCAPEFVGELVAEQENGEKCLKNILFQPHHRGNLKIWQHPDKSELVMDRYVVIVDVGGVSDEADFSDILVIDRYWMMDGGVPEVVAEWHGHIDHDRLAWKSAQIAQYYNEALLVIEANTLETEGTEGNNFEYILDEIADTYSNLYCRTPADQIRRGIPRKWGFHTNSATKPMVVSHQAKAIRDELYVERCIEAVWEHDTYEIKDDGKTLGAVEGMNDDRFMTRAIGVWICYQVEIPRRIGAKRQISYKTRIVSEASM